MTGLSMTKFDEIKATERQFDIGKLRMPDGKVEIRYGRVVKEKEPTHYVVFLHGRAEWIEKYAYVQADLALPKHVGFLTLDHRGQGGSGGTRAFIDSYDTYVSDVLQVIEKFTAGKPYVLVAHSMGALISLYGTITGRLTPRSLVLSSPFLGLPSRPVPTPIARPLSRALSNLGLGGLSSGAGDFGRAAFADNKLTHRADLYQRICAAPYKIPGATFGWVSASFQAIDTCFNQENLKKLATPTLVLAPSLENVVDPDCARRWALAAQSNAPAEVRLDVFHNARHELFSELPEIYCEAITSTRKWIQPHLEA